MNGILLIDKGLETTSHDVVNILRRELKIRRIGHTGTLDPNATGLLVMVVGTSTKLVPYLQKDDKEYIVEFKLGYSSDTLDIWGQVEEDVNYVPKTEEEIRTVIKTFVGNRKQTPPMYSAIKVQGRKLYELARQGKEIERAEREINIKEIEVMEINDNVRLRVVCSSGTYIRVLCDDIGISLGTRAIMTSLRRTRVGQFKIEDAYLKEDIEAGNYKLIESLTSLSSYQLIEYTPLDDILTGRRIKLDTTEDEVVITSNNTAIAVYEREHENTFRSKRGLW